MTKLTTARIARLLLGFGLLSKGEQSKFIQQFNDFFMVSRKQQRLLMDQWFNESTVDAASPVAPDLKRGHDSQAGLSGRMDGLFVDLLLMPVGERRSSWVEDITHALYAVEPILTRSLTALAEDSTFVSVFQEATHLAIRTAEPRKLKALKRLVLNSALDEDLPESAQQMYLSILASTTDVHLRLLERAHNARDPAASEDSIVNVGNGDEGIVGEAASLDDALDPAIAGRAVSELQAQGLVNIAESLSNPGALLEPSTLTLTLTRFGRRFLAFVS